MSMKPSSRTIPTSNGQNDRLRPQLGNFQTMKPRNFKVTLTPRGLFVPAAHAACDSRSEASAAPASPVPRAVRCCGPVEAHTDSSIAPRPAACKPCVRSAGTRPRRTQPLLLDRQAPPVFSDHRLQRLAVQTQFRNQKLQTTVLVFHRLQPLRLADLHAAELRLPAIERRCADPVLSA